MKRQSFAFVSKIDWLREEKKKDRERGRGGSVKPKTSDMANQLRLLLVFRKPPCPILLQPIQEDQNAIKKERKRNSKKIKERSKKELKDVAIVTACLAKIFLYLDS